MKVYMTHRAVTKMECPWLPRSIPAGTVLYEHADTYGVVVHGVSVSLTPGRDPYFEVPRGAVICWGNK